MPSKKRVMATREPSASSLKAPVTPMELLVMEAYAILFRGLTLFGISIPRQLELAEEARLAVGKVTAVSAQLLEQFRCVSELLTVWLQELPYVDASGRPKVLPIRGRGTTFESLARQFLPDRPLNEVVDLACKAGTVEKQSGGRIAVYGNPMINIAENPEATLAQAICHITNIIQTVEFNALRGKKDRTKGRVERLVNAPLTPEQFEIFSRLIRPQLDALCEHADRILKQLARTQTRGKRRLAGAGIGVYAYHRDSAEMTQRSSPRSRVVRRR